MANDAAGRMADQRADRSTVPWRECKDIGRRDRLETDPVAWLRHYLGATYSREFERPHLEIIRGAMHAHETGGRFCVAAERGIGKSAVLWGLILYLQLSGRERFPVCIPWSSPALRRAFRFWKNALCFNARLLADYPEVCGPFSHSKGVPQRVLASIWSHTHEPTGAQLSVGDGMIVMPDGLGVIGGATINGNPRGLNHPQPDGTVIRPTLALLDDVQDREVARSRSQILETIAVIDGDVAGLGEAGKDLPMLMSGNCIVCDDVMEHYLTSADWTGLRVPCVESWPAGWDEERGRVRNLWREWYELHRDGDGSDVPFYAEHRKEMTAGMSLSAPAAFRANEKAADEFCGAMRQYFKMGHESFAAERQQTPLKQGTTVYTLTPDVIADKVDKDRRPWEVPAWSRLRAAATDINPSYGLTWGIGAFGQDQTAGVLGYNIFDADPMPVPSGSTEADTARIIYESLVIHGRQLAALPCRPEAWGIDAGGSAFDVVLRFCAESAKLCGIQATPMTGRGARNYKPFGKSIVGKPREYCHMASDVRGRKWIAWHADYWREVAQRGWTGSIGAPGSCSLPTGNHRDFCEQICRETLKGKGEIGGAMQWVWNTQPGRHDFGDVMAMLYALAAWHGIGTAGSIVRRAPQPRRVCRVPLSENPA